MSIIVSPSFVPVFGVLNNLCFQGLSLNGFDASIYIRMNEMARLHYRYTLLNSDAPVIRWHIGQSFVAPRHLSQHVAQHVCQHPVDTVGSTCGDRQMRHVAGAG